MCASESRSVCAIPWNATPILSEPSASISCSYGCGLSIAFSVSASLASDTEKPSLTKEAACFRLAGVMKFNVPISSSLPQRPQLLRSFFHCSNCSLVTLWLAAPVPCGARALAVTATIITTEKIPNASVLNIGPSLPALHKKSGTAKQLDLKSVIANRQIRNKDVQYP